MAETDRCGRRKQRNPKRKNVEDEVSDIKQQKTVDVPTANSNHDNASKLDKDLHDGIQSENKDKNCADDSKKKTTKENESSSDNLKSDKAVKDLKEEVTSVVLPCKQPSCVTNSNNSAEEDKIQEYLNRSDTAVIYPEPVSDPEAQEPEASVPETEEEEEENQDNDSGLEEFILKCVFCTKTYTRSSVLKDHMKSAHPEQPVRYQCPKCEAIFMQKSFLDKHLPTHCPTSQSCKVCNKTFANVYRLQRHMISHDESTDLRKFKCPECGKAFKFKHHLKEHIRIHSGEKPFECPNCHKRFSHSGSYSSHMTSKKCWVAGPKAHTTERVNHMEPTVTYSKPLISKGAFTPPVHMLTSMAQGPFPRVPYLHFDPKGNMPFFSPPPAFVPYSYSMIRHSSPMNPLISLQGKTDCFSSHHSISPSHGSTAQISPDVNSNTQLFSMHKPTVKDSPVIKREPESKEEPSSTDSASAPKERTFKDSKPRDDAEKKTTSDAEDVKPDIKMEEQEKEKIPCHFCSEVFNSAVDQHQHERYLCKANKELLNRSSFSDSSRNSPCSSISDASHRGTPNGSYSAPDTDHEDDCESKKFRMRTHISEEQLAVLKSHYKENPRPRKFELIRIGKEIGKEKRVVQVWFQNMRARDRRQGKHVPYVPSMARFKHSDNSSWKEHSPSHSSYIPVVPNTTRAHGKKMDVPSTSKPEEQPLDLSVRSRTPTPAHASSPCSSTSSSSIPLKSSSLNISGKVDNGTEGSKKEGRLQSSAIYKYLQQEGMLPRHFFGNYLPHPPTSMFQPFLQAHMMASPEAIMSRHFEHRSKSAEPAPKPSFTDINRNSATPMDSKVFFEQNGEKAGRLMIDESQDEDSNCSSDSYSDSEQYRRAMADATLNLATLAEVSLSQRAALMENSLKSKRLRKKSWRQVHGYMEAEEVQMDLDDSLLDDDNPLKKKRRSWKGHKIDAEEGMYACDQCAKVFSKQSSLARHKYEHSGARPFTCEICGKAFKHKHHLTEHRRLHSGEKPFECKKCGKRFSHSGSYSQHMNHRYKYCKPLREDGFSSS